MYPKLKIVAPYLVNIMECCDLHPKTMKRRALKSRVSSKVSSKHCDFHNSKADMKECLN